MPHAAPRAIPRKSKLAVGLCLCALMTAPFAAQQPGGDPDFAAADAAVLRYLDEAAIPGATIAIGINDRIVHARGYGVKARSTGQPMPGDVESRLASLSKPLTAVAVLRLVDQGKLRINDPALPYLRQFNTSTPRDPLLQSVTIRQLLTHSWGLDRAITSETWGWDSRSPDTGCRDSLRYYVEQQFLNFPPGTKYSYNNLGFCWLGLIAESVDGRPLDVQLSAMLGSEPLSNGRVRFANSQAAASFPEEPYYHDRTGAPSVTPWPGLYPGTSPVPRPYAYGMSHYGGSGQLVTSAVTYTRFLQRLMGARTPHLLSGPTLEQMLTPSTVYAGHGLGISVATYCRVGDPAGCGVGYTGLTWGTRTVFGSYPLVTSGPRLTIVATLNSHRTSDISSVDDVSTDLLVPLVNAMRALGSARLSAKPEISAVSSSSAAPRLSTAMP
jgi:CubicO group peptidase (beta-lactamase class C family)